MGLWGSLSFLSLVFFCSSDWVVSCICLHIHRFFSLYSTVKPILWLLKFFIANVTEFPVLLKIPFFLMMALPTWKLYIFELFNVKIWTVSQSRGNNLPVPITKLYQWLTRGQASFMFTLSNLPLHSWVFQSNSQISLCHRKTSQYSL